MLDSGPIEVAIRRVALCFLPIGLPRMSCLALACLPLCLLACLSSPLAPPSVRGKKNSNQAEIIREEEKSDGQADVSQKDHLLLSSLTASLYLSQQEGFVEE